MGISTLSSGSIPCMDWEKYDSESAWKFFYQHVQFMFKRPLKDKDEAEQCSLSHVMGW